MEFPFSNAIVSAHVHATEEEQLVLEALRTFLPGEVEVGRSKLKGHHGNPIVALEAKVNRRRLLRELWQRALDKLRVGEIDKLRALVPERVDDSCCLYLRFDKQLAHGGELVLTDSGDAIHLRLKVVAFPAKREVAIGLIENFVGGGARR